MELDIADPDKQAWWLVEEPNYSLACWWPVSSRA